MGAGGRGGKAFLRLGATLTVVLLLATSVCAGADGDGDSEEVEPRAMDEDRSRRRPPQVKIGGHICAEMGTKDKCVMQNGCSWCVQGMRRRDAKSTSPNPLKKSSGDGSAMCTDWRTCKAAGQCESRNSTLCQGVGGKKDGVECIWCDSEERCLQKEASVGAWGQCLGCDGVYDSGLIIDSCGICGGSCIYLSRQEAVGISLALSGNFLISISLNLQKHAHNLNEASSVSAQPR